MVDTEYLNIFSISQLLKPIDILMFNKFISETMHVFVISYYFSRYMYWTDNAVTNPRVMTSNLGGRHVNVLFRLHNTRATSLTMDYGEER